jgi:Tfp pilus assembly protein PilX
MNLATCPVRSQRGVVLFIALIVLVAMTLAGIALIRGVDSANLIAGNLAFKQVATLAGDWGVEQARTWLNAQAPATLDADQPAVSGGPGYWANMQSGVDFTGTDPAKPDYPWLPSLPSSAVDLGSDGNGNQVQYVIHRLCVAAGPSSGVQCVRGTGGGTTTGTKGGATYGSFALSGTTQVYYRVTTRVAGPRGTVSYVQVMVN